MKTFGDLQKFMDDTHKAAKEFHVDCCKMEHSGSLKEEDRYYMQQLAELLNITQNVPASIDEEFANKNIDINKDTYFPRD